MAMVQDILAVKGFQVLTVGPEATVLEACMLMNRQKVGSVIVVAEGNICGMFTERDVLQRVVVPRRDPGATLVEEVMTREVICCQPHTSIEEARSVMKNRRIRHMPVLDEGNLCGLISIGDLNAHDANHKELTIHMLEEYIHGYV